MPKNNVLLKAHKINHNSVNIQVLSGKFLKGPAMVWCEVHALLIVHKTNYKLSKQSIYL